MITSRRTPILMLATALVAAGCGGSDVSASVLVDRCLKKQPDATQSDCNKWQKDGKLNDDGTHEDHKG